MLQNFGTNVTSRISQKEKTRERFKAAFAVLLLIFTLGSVIFVAHEMHHQCDGEDCHICHIIQICDQNIKLLGFALATFAAVRLARQKPGKALSAIEKSPVTYDTLISRKIRLND